MEMRARLLALGGILILAASTASAQGEKKVSTATYDDVYCSGQIDGQAPPSGVYIVTGQEANSDSSFQEGDYVYVNKGSSQGVKVGDEFSVVRHISDPTTYPWFKWQFAIMQKLGQMWEDEGRLKVVVAQPNISITQIEDSCNYMQRSDIVVPFTERMVPQIRTEDHFDRFAPPSGKPLAMVVVAKDFVSAAGTNDTVYVNLGAGQGVKVGDYFRFFRYTGQNNETVYQLRNYAFQVFGFGGTSGIYTWQNTPREVLGEGVVMRATANSATVLITFSLREIYAGDYVEIE
jgi:hypothetical protein